MADAEIKKIIGNVLDLETSSNSSIFIYIYDSSEGMVKYEISQ